MKTTAQLAATGSRRKWPLKLLTVLGLGQKAPIFSFNQFVCSVLLQLSVELEHYRQLNKHMDTYCCRVGQQIQQVTKVTWQWLYQIPPNFRDIETPMKYDVPSAPKSFHPKRDPDPFSHFCRVQSCTTDKQTDTSHHADFNRNRRTSWF